MLGMKGGQTARSRLIFSGFSSFITILRGPFVQSHFFSDRILTLPFLVVNNKTHDSNNDSALLSIIDESTISIRSFNTTTTTQPTSLLKKNNTNIFSKQSNKNNTIMTASETSSLKSIISPSLLSCDLANLSEDAKDMLHLGADWLHLDVMDGHFVPNLSFGAPVIKCLHTAHPNAFLDVHLMVSNPMFFVKPMADAGVTQFTFHIESDMPQDGEAGVHELINAIKKAGMKVGITLKPGTSIDKIIPYIDMVDLILVMTVEPGFSGQSFMKDMMSKVKELRDKYPTKNISVDGGLSPKTVDEATAAGANVIVSASAIFGSNDRASVINTLRQSVDNALASSS